MKILLSLLFTGCAFAASPETAVRSFFRAYDARHYEEASTIAADALRAHPQDPTLLGLLGMASAQIPGGIEFALEVWRKAIAEGATVRIPGYRLPNIRAGFNIAKALSVSSKRTIGALLIDANEVRFVAESAEQSFRLPIASMGISDTPGPMSVATPGVIGYNGASWDQGSIFVSGKVEGKKVEIPVFLLGSGRKVVAGYAGATYLDWQIRGTGWLAYVCIQSMRRPGDLPSDLKPSTHHAQSQVIGRR